MLPENEQEVSPKHVGTLININTVQQFDVKHNVVGNCSIFFCYRIKPIRDKQLKNKGAEVQITSEDYNQETRLKNFIKQY